MKMKTTVAMASSRKAKLAQLASFLAEATLVGLVRAS